MVTHTAHIILCYRWQVKVQYRSSGCRGCSLWPPFWYHYYPSSKTLKELWKPRFFFCAHKELKCHVERLFIYLFSICLLDISGVCSWQNKAETSKRPPWEYFQAKVEKWKELFVLSSPRRQSRRRAWCPSGSAGRPAACPAGWGWGPGSDMSSSTPRTARCASSTPRRQRSVSSMMSAVSLRSCTAVRVCFVLFFLLFTGLKFEAWMSQRDKHKEIQSWDRQ